MRSSTGDKPVPRPAPPAAPGKGWSASLASSSPAQTAGALNSTASLPTADPASGRVSALAAQGARAVAAAKASTMRPSDARNYIKRLPPTVQSYLAANPSFDANSGAWTGPPVASAALAAPHHQEYTPNGRRHDLPRAYQAAPAFHEFEQQAAMLPVASAILIQRQASELLRRANDAAGGANAASNAAADGNGDSSLFSPSSRPPSSSHPSSSASANGTSDSFSGAASALGPGRRPASGVRASAHSSALLSDAAAAAAAVVEAASSASSGTGGSRVIAQLTRRTDSSLANNNNNNTSSSVNNNYAISSNNGKSGVMMHGPAQTSRFNANNSLNQPLSSSSSSSSSSSGGGTATAAVLSALATPAAPYAPSLYYSFDVGAPSLTDPASSLSAARTHALRGAVRESASCSAPQKTLLLADARRRRGEALLAAIAPRATLAELTVPVTSSLGAHTATLSLLQTLAALRRDLDATFASVSARAPVKAQSGRLARRLARVWEQQHPLVRDALAGEAARELATRDARTAAAARARAERRERRRIPGVLAGSLAARLLVTAHGISLTGDGDGAGNSGGKGLSELSESEAAGGESDSDYVNTANGDGDDDDGDEDGFGNGSDTSSLEESKLGRVSTGRSGRRSRHHGKSKGTASLSGGSGGALDLNPGARTVGPNGESMEQWLLRQINSSTANTNANTMFNKSATATGNVSSSSHPPSSGTSTGAGVEGDILWLTQPDPTLLRGVHYVHQALGKIINFALAPSTAGPSTAGAGPAVSAADAGSIKTAARDGTGGLDISPSGITVTATLSGNPLSSGDKTAASAPASGGASGGG